MNKAGIAEYSILGKIPGRELELIVAQHPFYDRESLVIVGDHVTIETGTGCVHTAPGFGVDDFNICRKYPQIPFVAPVNSRGVMTEEALQYQGLHYSKANEAILKTSGVGRSSRRRKSSTPIPTAGAAKIRSSSGLPSNGSRPWTP